MALGPASDADPVTVCDPHDVAHANSHADGRRPHPDGDRYGECFGNANGHVLSYAGAQPDVNDGGQPNAQRHMDGYPYPNTHRNARTLSNSHPD